MIQVMSDKPITVCCKCGHPLKAGEIAMTVIGEMILWNSRAKGQIVMYYCEECLDSYNQLMKSGIDGALKRLEELKAMDEEDKNEHEYK